MKEEKAKKGLLDRILDTIERVGNRLPDPITLFLGLAIVVVLISWLCSALGAKALNPAWNGARGRHRFVRVGEERFPRGSDGAFPGRRQGMDRLHGDYFPGN